MSAQARAILPYADGCRHDSPCGNVFAGRACALDPSKENNYDQWGRAYVQFVIDDEARGVAAGSCLLAFDPYTGVPSGERRAAR